MKASERRNLKKSILGCPDKTFEGIQSNLAMIKALCYLKDEDQIEVIIRSDLPCPSRYNIVVKEAEDRAPQRRILVSLTPTLSRDT